MAMVSAVVLAECWQDTRYAYLRMMYMIRGLEICQRLDINGTKEQQKLVPN